MRILVIEDEAVLCEQIANDLKSAGYTVDKALDGEEGLYLATEYSFDLMVIDLGLPKISGMDIIIKLRNDDNHCPILILTARDHWQDKVDGLSAGADMAHSLGCVLSDKVAAISPVAGAVACKDAADEEYIYPPNPENPVPVIIFHGTNDPSFPWEGDQYNCAVNDSVQFWVEHNGCDPDPEINVSESGNIVRYTYSNGNDGSEVILYKTIGGGHWWPGNDFTNPDDNAPWLVDTIQEIDATDLMWEFFEQHPKQ